MEFIQFKRIFIIQAINGGFMLVLDGKDETDRRIKSMIGWDVNNGTARRAWSGN